MSGMSFPRGLTHRGGQTSPLSLDRGSVRMSESYFPPEFGLEAKKSQIGFFGGEGGPAFLSRKPGPPPPMSRCRIGVALPHSDDPDKSDKSDNAYDPDNLDGKVSRIRHASKTLQERVGGVLRLPGRVASPGRRSWLGRREGGQGEDGERRRVLFPGTCRP